MSSVVRSILIAGTGPASVQLAVLVKRWRDSRVGIAGRHSVRSAPFFEALRRSDRRLTVDISHASLEALQGQHQVDELFEHYGDARGEWDTLILSVTADAYIPVLRQLCPRLLQSLSCVVLLSPTFGSHALVRQFGRKQGMKADIISFSTYLGDTRREDEGAANRVLTTAAKRKVYIGAADGRSEDNLQWFQSLYAAAGIEVELLASALAAESRNISLYVHPPLFMNDFSLRAIFGQASVPGYVYKLFPEGPITQNLIAEMLSQWGEISALSRKLGLEELNLLRFMIDDNYPIRPESLARENIDNFINLSPIHQQYCLYVRYASLLIDPYSTPDRTGRYFDFSAVPLRSVFMNAEGRLDIPRMPKEDYYRLKVIQGIASAAGVPCPTVDQFLIRYEQRLQIAASSATDIHLSEAFALQSFQYDIQSICKELLHADDAEP